MIKLEIKGIQDRYFITKDGVVFTDRNRGRACKELREIPASIDFKGYLRLCLAKVGGGQKAYGVHQLVAIAYLGHEPNGIKEICYHIDGNKLNNSPGNLQISRSNGEVKFLSSICLPGVECAIHLGYYHTQQEVMEKYLIALKFVEINEPTKEEFLIFRDSGLFGK